MRLKVKNWLLVCGVILLAAVCIFAACVFDAAKEEQSLFRETAGKSLRVVSQDVSENDASELFVEQKNIASVESGIELPAYSNKAGEKGVRLTSSAANASVMYGKTLKVSDLTKDDTIISFQVEEASGYNLSELRIRLIDAYDTANSIALYLWANPWAPKNTYALVEYGSYSLGISEGIVRPEYGAVMWDFSFSGETNAMKNAKLFNMRFDYEEQVVYMSNGTSLVEILDLDDASELPEVWKGFTGEEAFLRVEWAMGSGSLIVNEVMGQQFSDGTEIDLSDENIIMFEEPPFLPDGAVGYPYKLPKAYDAPLLHEDIQISCTLLCEKNLFTLDSSSSLRQDSFVPLNSGRYTLRYECMDQFGSLVNKTFEFTVYDTPKPFEISVSQSETDIMSYYSVPVPEITGGAGKYTVNITLKNNGVEKVVQPGDRILIDNKNDYVLNVSVTDSIGYSDSKEFVIPVNTDVRFYHNANVLRTLRGGTVVQFPDIQVTDFLYEPGDVGYDMEVDVFVDDVPLSDNMYEVPSENKTIILKYAVGGGGDRAFDITYPIRIVSDYTLDVNEVLATQNMDSREVFQFGTAFAFSQSSAINMPFPVSSQNLKVSFSLLKEYTAFNSVQLTLTDYSDSDKKIELILTDMLTETPKLYLNGTLQDSTIKFQDSEYRSGKYAGEENRTFVFLYDNLLGKFFGENNIELFTPQTYADGNQFEGFSGGVYVDIVCGEVDAQSLFVLNMLSNQSFNAASFPNDSELQGPEIYTGIAGETVTSINSVFSVPEVQAFDVLQHSATCTINIYDPDNRHIVHNLKMDGEYLLALTKYGVYRIEYDAVDYIGNVTRKTLTIVVKDEIAPEIEMKGEILPTYKLNEELHIPEVTVRDNIDAEVKVQLLIRTPDRGFKAVNSGETFALAAKGKYEFIVYAMDASGNLLYKSFPFEVQ